MARTTFRLPSLLQPAVGDVRQVAVEGATVREALEDLCRLHPTLRVRLLTAQGALRPHVLVIHAGQVLRGDDDAPLADDDQLEIMPAVSGG